MPVKKSDIKQFFLETRIADVMASPVITVKETDDFALVQEKIALYDIRHLPVVNDAGTLAGLISQRDLYQIHSPRRLDDGTWYYDKEALNQFLLTKVMVKNPFTLKSDDTLYSAMDAMARFKFGCIPIVDDYRKPCGILTRDTILKFCISKEA
ncbi:MAG: CBS domain-containing protein [Candidatus Omnitrophica bacterium]|nr:CBS domain-containing protein [Candidatus Omnitrophota bacterium]MDE2221817.1 CBS domain-containing protein [Candidatus Omnitrophota bacterium]